MQVSDLLAVTRILSVFHCDQSAGTIFSCFLSWRVCSTGTLQLVWMQYLRALPKTYNLPMRYCALHPSFINSGKFHTSHLYESELTFYLIAHLPMHGIISWINRADSWKVNNAWEMEIASCTCNFFRKELYLTGFDKSFETIQLLDLKSPMYNCMAFKC